MRPICSVWLNVVAAASSAGLQMGVVGGCGSAGVGGCGWVWLGVVGCGVASVPLVRKRAAVPGGGEIRCVATVGARSFPAAVTSGDLTLV